MQPMQRTSGKQQRPTQEPVCSMLLLQDVAATGQLAEWQQGLLLV
jgi:hypothetical protein